MLRKNWRWSMLAVLAASFCVLAVSGLELLPRTEVFIGPFPGDGKTSARHVPVGQVYGSLRLPAQSDSLDSPERSRLQLWVDGQEYRLPHTSHALIREGWPHYFSHWDGYVLFTLPAGAPNDVTTEVRVRYPIEFSNRLLLLTLLTLCLAGIWFLTRNLLDLNATLAVLRRRRGTGTVLIATTMACLILVEAGIVQHAEVINGPFIRDGDSERLLAPVGNQLPFTPHLEPRSDGINSPFRSDLQLETDGTSPRMPHGSSSGLRQGSTDTFSHWGRNVFFALPEGTPNGPETQLRLTYPLQLPSAWWTAGLMIALLVIWVLIEHPWLNYRRVVAVTAVLLAALAGQHFLPARNTIAPAETAGLSRPPPEDPLSAQIPNFSRFTGESDLTYLSRVSEVVHKATWNCYSHDFRLSLIEQLVTALSFTSLWDHGILVTEEFRCGLCHQRAFQLSRAIASGGLESEVYGLAGHVVLRVQTSAGSYFADPDYGIEPFPVGENPEAAYVPLPFADAKQIASFYLTTANNEPYAPGLLEESEARQALAFQIANALAVLALVTAGLLAGWALWPRAER